MFNLGAAAQRKRPFHMLSAWLLVLAWSDQVTSDADVTCDANKPGGCSCVKDCCSSYLATNQSLCRKVRSWN